MKNLPFSTTARGGLLLGLLLAARSGNLLAQVPAAAEDSFFTPPAVLGLLLGLLVVVVGAAIGLLVRVAWLGRSRQLPPPFMRPENGRLDEKTVPNSRSVPTHRARVAPRASVGTFI